MIGDLRPTGQPHMEQRPRVLQTGMTIEVLCKEQVDKMYKGFAIKSISSGLNAHQVELCYEC